MRLITVAIVLVVGAAAVVAMTVLHRPTNSAHSWLIVDPAGPSMVRGERGVITGSLRVTAPSGQPLHYTVSGTTYGPTSGQLTVDGVTGTYTYTPTQATLLRASDSWADNEQSFSVAVTDGSHDPVTVPVTVPVAPVQLSVAKPPITVGKRPLHVAVSPDGSRAYVLNAGDGGTVSVIDTAANAPLGIPIRLSKVYPSRFATTPDGKRLYVTDVETHTVSVVDIATSAVVGGPIRVGDGPLGVAISPDGARVYVGDADNGTVTVIEASDNSVASVIQVGAAVYGLAVSPDGTRVYAIDRGVRVNNAYGKGTVSVIDTATNAVIGKPITVGLAPEDVAVSPNGDRVYVVNADESTVSVIDSHSNTVEGEPIGVGPSPAAVALSPDGSLAYVTDTGNGTLSVIDTAAKTLVGAPIPVAPGGLLYGVAVSRDGTHIYATDFNGGTVSVVSHVPA